MPQKSNQELVTVRNRLLDVATSAVKHSAMTLARHGVDAEKFSMIVREALIANPDIVEADEASLAKAIRQCCRDNIVPDGDQGALVVFAGKARVLTMVTGLLRMAAEDLEAEIRSGVIHEGDNVTVIEGVGGGADPSITITSQGTDIFLSRTGQNVIGSYCWLKLPFEDTARLVLFTLDQIRRAREMSKAKDSFWARWPERGAEKSCIKSAIWRLRYLAYVRNKGSRILEIIQAENEQEYGAGTVTDLVYGDQSVDVIDTETGEVLQEGKPAPKPKPKPKPAVLTQAAAQPPQTAAEPARPEPAKSPQAQPVDPDPDPAGQDTQRDGELGLGQGDGFIPKSAFVDDPTSL